MRFVHDADDAEDVAQRAFVRAFLKLADFRGEARFGTWLYRIAVNLCLNHRRDRARLVRVEDEGEMGGSEAVGAGRMLVAERSARLRAAVAELPPKQRVVLELRVYDELPFKEVAAIAGCTENAAKVNFHYAVRRLRELLGGEARGGAGGSARADAGEGP
jgi:RNA polymerase sigma-70 factor (ECF subfamily)